ncbi:MAG: InlB B-repeat-containing protein, partial [Bacteroidales bacterium]
GNGSVTGSGTYNYNTELTITATAHTGSKFVAWFEGENLISNSSTYSFKVVRNINLQARFAKNTYTITARNGEGGNVTGGGQYEYGTTATLTAIPNTGHYVAGWREGSNMVSNSAKYSFEVLGDRTLEAVFAKNRYTVTTNASEGGSVTGGGTYEYGQAATLTATPNTGYHFVKWSDNTNISPKKITITDNVTISAIFAKNTYSVTTNISGEGSVSAGGNYLYNEISTLTAQPHSDSYFVGWFKNSVLISTDLVFTFNVTENVQLEAKFEKLIKVTLSANYRGTEVYINGIAHDSRFPYKGKVGEIIQIKADNPSRAFLKWQDRATGETISSSQTYNYTISAKSGNILAIFK